MNEINFEIKDDETINLVMDVGIKEIYPPIENLEVTPTKEKQIFTHENSYGYDNVTVVPIPEEYIIPDGTLPITENTTYDVRRFAKVTASVHPTPNLQDKEVTPTKDVQTVAADEGYDGLNNVTVNPIPDEYVIPSGVLNITGNGTKDVTNYAEVNVDVQATVSGGNSINVFTQEEEPETKEGLWLQTSEKYDSVSLWSRPTETIINSRPQLGFSYCNGSIAIIGSMVYLFGGDATSSSPKYAYKYNLADDTWAKMSNMPYNCSYNPAIAIGTDIYIGGAWNSTDFYKFDSTTESYTKLANSPVKICGARPVLIGDIIYFMGGEYTYSGIYKYSITNNTWSKSTTSTPEPLIDTGLFGLGTDIYLISNRCYSSSAGHYTSPHNYVFDTITETFRTLQSVTPNNFKNLYASVRDNFVYLVGSDVEANCIYKYYPSTDSYVRCGTLAGGYASSPIHWNNEFLAFGSYSVKTQLLSASVLEDTTPSQNGKTVIVDTINEPLEASKSFKLMEIPSTLLDYKHNTVYFADILYKLNENNIDVPIYYGDGTQWIKVKN